MQLYTMLAHFLAAYTALAAEDTSCSDALTPGGPCHKHQLGRSDTNQPVETETQRKMETDKAMKFSITPQEAYKTEAAEEPQKQNIAEILRRPRAGGEFGLSAQWREAIAIPAMGSNRSEIRGGRCQTEEMMERVRIILERRRKTPADSRVAICVRSKDFGRFLPEWVAFHYVLGVDEVKLFDDDSVDRTGQALFPFMQAGIVKYKLEKISKSSEMKPLNECLHFYLDKRSKDPHAPRWILFHDTDEYMFPVDTSLTIPEALSSHNSTCCVQVMRVQYGSGNLIETPRGLVLENFLTHADPRNARENRFPKVMVNLDPTEPEKGVVAPKLPSMHNAHGCECETPKVTEMRINHYLGSLGDFYDHSRRYWEKYLKEQPTQRKVEKRDINDHTSDTITFWACATREILYRIAHTLDLETGLDKTSP